MIDLPEDFRDLLRLTTRAPSSWCARARDLADVKALETIAGRESP